MSLMRAGDYCIGAARRSRPVELLTRYPSWIADLDPDTLLALVYTATTCLAWALRDTIYNHLAFKASISVNTRVKNEVHGSSPRWRTSLIQRLADWREEIPPRP